MKRKKDKKTKEPRKDISGQARQSTGRMPGHKEPTKDARSSESHDKPQVAQESWVSEWGNPMGEDPIIRS
jgi:hypothetical protein